MSTDAGRSLRLIDLHPEAADVYFPGNGVGGDEADGTTPEPKQGQAGGIVSSKEARRKVVEMGEKLPEVTR